MNKSESLIKLNNYDDSINNNNYLKINIFVSTFDKTSYLNIYKYKNII